MQVRRLYFVDSVQVFLMLKTYVAQIDSSLKMLIKSHKHETDTIEGAIVTMLKIFTDIIVLYNKHFLI